MTRFDYRIEDEPGATIGLIALQADERIERDFRRLMPAEARLLVSRVGSERDVTLDSLRAMEARLTTAATLFPRGLDFAAIGYGCTSGAATIGLERVAENIRAGAPTEAVAEPVSALLAACRALRVRRLAMLSPYIAPVSAHLRAVLAEAGVETPVFGGFDEAEEARVARIASASVHDAALRLAAGADVDAVFLSCTNLRSLEVIEPLEQALGLPVLSSNQALAWRLTRLAGLAPPAGSPGRLFAATG